MKCLRLLALLLVVSLAPPAFAQGTAPNPDSAPNPTAESVNEEMLFKQESKIGGRITIPDERAQYLIQPQGRDWRQFHETYLPWIAGAAIILMLIALVMFYMLVGPAKSEFKPTGQRIVRFRGIERFTHWITAVSFILLGLTGLNYFFGKRLIAPLIGPVAFGDFSQYAKYAHNFFAWPFTLGVLMMVFFWVRDNIPSRGDWAWLKAGGGLVGNRHISAGRFNAGQKIVFWGVVLGGTLMFISGLILLFPFEWVDVNGMQLTNVVHGLIGSLFVAGILAHIYIGTIGMEGDFEAMVEGTVDLGWARQHHDRWAEEVAGTARRDDPPAPPPAGARQRI
ncbi:MAG: formate dehydrogenase, gamma subunit [Hyphomicrobiales bacterium]|nr:formate dehydrogenase, gamma subunit [Hyphomicrobiales bacterium]